MTSPLAWLAGLGQGAESLGSDINQRNVLQAAKRRQDAIDAQNWLLTQQKLGAFDAPSGMTPSVFQQGMQRRNDAESGMIPGGTMSAIPNEAAGLSDAEVPNAFGPTRTVTIPGPDGTPRTVVIDPSRTPEALQERRLMRQQDAMLRRQQDEDRAKTARDQAKIDAETKAKTDAAAKQAQADYNTLKATNPKHVLVQAPFDPANAANYGAALRFEEQKQLQASQYHPEGDWAPSGAVDKDTGEPILYNKRTGAKMTLSGAVQGGKSGALAGQTMQTMARMGMSYNDLQQTVDRMEKFENDPKNRALLTPTTQAVGAMAEVQPSQEARGLIGGINNAAGAWLGAKAQEKLAADNPAYRTYLNDRQRVATAFTELLPRPNQQLLQIERGLSGIDVGWNPTLITSVQSRRRGGMDVLHGILQQQGMLDEGGGVRGVTGGGGKTVTINGREYHVP